jgi:hypothetical protein
MPLCRISNARKEVDYKFHSRESHSDSQRCNMVVNRTNKDVNSCLDSLATGLREPPGAKSDKKIAEANEKFLKESQMRNDGGGVEIWARKCPNRFQYR